MLRLNLHKQTVDSHLPATVAVICNLTVQLASESAICFSYCWWSRCVSTSKQVLYVMRYISKCKPRPQTCMEQKAFRSILFHWIFQIDWTAQMAYLFNEAGVTGSTKVVLPYPNYVTNLTTLINGLESSSRSRWVLKLWRSYLGLTNINDISVWIFQKILVF